jgi:flagellar assembly protein FliH
MLVDSQRKSTMQVIKRGSGSLAYEPWTLPNIENREAEVAGQARPEPIIERFVPQAQAIAHPETHQEASASLIEQARAEAAQILNQAAAQINELERVAREKAVAEVRAAIAAETASEAAGLQAQLAQTLEEVTELREQMATYAENEMVQLAIEIAKKIVRREVTVDREIVISLARVALARLHNRVLASVRLHPEDYQYVAAHREKLGTASTIKLIEDASISRGGCLIETDFGDVDARIEQQFNEIERGFLNDLTA